MNGQFLMNKAITAQYAFKKDGKGERHGTPAERLLAAQARKNNALPVSARPPPATLNALAAFGPPTLMSAPATSVNPVAGAPVYGLPGPYQGQFAGALATAHAPSSSPGMGMGVPPPPPGFGGVSGGVPMGIPGIPSMPTPPPGFASYNPPVGMNMGMPPPPPSGFGAPGVGMPPPPHGFTQEGAPMHLTPPPPPR